MKLEYLSFLIKPASARCNLHCPYCFYEDVSSRRENVCGEMMDEALMELLIDRAIQETSDTAHITLAFQGGEPMLAGLEFYEKLTAYAEKKKGGRTFAYAIQTNGTLIDEAWAEFFARKHVLVGVSLDGYESNTNKFRIDKKGKGMFGKIMEGIGYLKRAGAAYNILSVITAQLASHPEAYYKFMKSQGISHVQCIPCLGELDRKTQWELDADGYEKFFKRLFRIWLADYMQGDYMSIGLFDNLLLMFADRPPQQCGMLGFCTAQLVVESDGNVYPCDFYVLDEYCCGNLREKTVEEILTSEVMKRFLQEEKVVPKICETCGFWNLCRGGCKRQNTCYLQEKRCGHQEFLKEAAPMLYRIANSLR